MEYTDGAGRTRRKVVAPSKIFVDEGVYYAAVWTDVLDSTPEDRRKFVSRDQLINKANGKPRTWQVLRLARIEHAEVIAPVKRVDIPDMPVSELRQVELRQRHSGRVHHGSAGSSVHQVDAGSHRRAVRPARKC